MVSWSGLLNRKYDIQQQNASTAAMTGAAEARLNAARAAGMPASTAAQTALTRARAEALPAATAADIARSNAQVGLFGAQAEGLRESTIGERADFLDPMGVRSARTGLARSQAGFQDANARLTDEQTFSERWRRPRTGTFDGQWGMPRLGGTARTGTFGMLPEPSAEERLDAERWWGSAPADDRYRSNQQRGLGFAKGTARVPGKGDGTKDTVKAKLAPGEAVLNKAASDKLGRGMIAALNAQGARKMGLV